MQKHYHLFIALLFCGLLAGFFALNLLAPDSEFSQTENRPLAALPTPILGNINPFAASIGAGGNLVNGQFMSSFETYVTDQFIGRDQWVATKARLEKLLGKGENNGVYIGDQETLIPQFNRPTQSQVDTNINYLNTLVGNLSVPVHLSLLPNKVSLWADRLPEGAPNADESLYLQQVQDKFQGIWVDANGILTQHAHEDIFYRTDHHWTSLGAYYGYVALMNSMGIEPLPLSTYKKTTVSTNFNGTTYSTAGVRWFTPDVIDIYVPADGITVTSTTGSITEERALYMMDFLAKKDQYAMFLGGNQPLGVVTTPNTEAPKLLLVRDSFADAMVPFLTAHFSEIHLVDLRYYKASIPSYVDANGIDDVAVMFGLTGFVADQNLFALGVG